MRLNTRTTAWLALVLAALLAGTAVADDRDFLRKLSAPPNLIFILDTSGSMVGSPEEPGYQMNSTVPYGMVPGGGDDYYSRMGIAKRVLKEFLADVTDANYVLAGYAQERSIRTTSTWSSSNMPTGSVMPRPTPASSSTTRPTSTRGR